ESEKLMKDNLTGLRENKKGRMNPYTTCNLSSAKIGDYSRPGILAEEQQKWKLYPPTEKISGNVDEVIEETVKKILLQLTTPAPAGKKVHGLKSDDYRDQNGKPIEYYFNATKIKQAWLKKHITRIEGDPKRCSDPSMYKIYGGKTKCFKAMQEKFARYENAAKSGTALGEKTYNAFLPISLFFEPMQDNEEKRNIKKRWNSLSPDNKAKVIKKLKHIKVGVRTKTGNKEKLLRLFKFHDGGLDQKELSEVRGGKKTRRRRRRKKKHTKKKRRRKRTKKSRRRRKKKSRRRR
ncbi:MAG: hypothetical protein CMP10_21965, partial [Zetaproteobacteria bacterium]|nr:hypothetical protein [Pseudobdellovibrionaceae bacterium]